jgi:hypothetical protein
MVGQLVDMVPDYPITINIPHKLRTLEVKGAATEASASDKETPT